jgi:hypothetical protein
MPAQMRRGLDRRLLAPSHQHPRRHISEQPGRQPDRADGFELLDLNQHRLQAHVPRRRLDQPKHATRLSTLLVDHRGQRFGSVGCRGRDAGGDPLGQRPLGGVDRGPHDPIDQPLRWRLDPPAPAQRQQLLTHNILAGIAARDVLCQPSLDRLRVLDRALTEAEMTADLRTVKLDRPPRELVASEVDGRGPHLAGDELDHLTRQVAVAVREAAVTAVELQHQREHEPRRAALARDQLPLAVKQRPMLDQLVQLKPLGTHPGKFRESPETEHYVRLRGGTSPLLRRATPAIPPSSDARYTSGTHRRQAPT